MQRGHCSSDRAKPPRALRPEPPLRRLRGMAASRGCQAWPLWGRRLRHAWCAPCAVRRAVSACACRCLPLQGELPVSMRPCVRACVRPPVRAFVGRPLPTARRCHPPARPARRPLPIPLLLPVSVSPCPCLCSLPLPLSLSLPAPAAAAAGASCPCPCVRACVRACVRPSARACVRASAPCRPHTAAVRPHVRLDCRPLPLPLPPS